MREPTSHVKEPIAVEGFVHEFALGSLTAVLARFHLGGNTVRVAFAADSRAVRILYCDAHNLYRLRDTSRAPGRTTRYCAGPVQKSYLGILSQPANFALTWRAGEDAYGICSAGTASHSHFQSSN